VPTRLYVMPISNAAGAGAAMVAHKRIPHRLVRLMPGLHPLLVRFAGFHDFTVPALEHDGRKLQGTRRIARFLDEVRPDPPLFPIDPERRGRMEEAERWGEQAFQPVPRRLFRHLLLTSESARLWMGTEVMHLPAPRAMAVLFMPVIRRLAAIRTRMRRISRSWPAWPCCGRSPTWSTRSTAGACEAAARGLYPEWPPMPSGLPMT
jgi:glutathione S-transferase